VAQGKEFRLPNYPVCVECKLQGNPCLYDLGMDCMGVVARAGCQAICPSFGDPCEACRGFVDDPNTQSHQEVLEKAGFLAKGKDGSIDWQHTRAYVQNGIFVNVNLQGRDRHGIVPPERFDKTCDEIIAALHAYVEPRAGLHPFNLVLRKADMRYVGLYGDPGAKKIGDIVFTYREPFGGTHGEQLSTARWSISSNTCLLIMRGPGIRPGVQLERTVWLTDIVPTICHLIDIPVPRDTEGAILYQALESHADAIAR